AGGGLDPSLALLDNLADLLLRLVGQDNVDAGRLAVRGDHRGVEPGPVAVTKEIIARPGLEIGAAEIEPPGAEITRHGCRRLKRRRRDGAEQTAGDSSAEKHQKIAPSHEITARENRTRAPCPAV